MHRLPSLTPLAALLVSAPLVFAQTAAPTEKVPHKEVIIMLDTHAAVSGADTTGTKKVQVFRTGSGEHGSEIDIAVSDALSEAFSAAPLSSLSSLSSISTLSNLAASPKAIANAPFSAEIITEKTQTLADGNRIVRRSATLSYRDSAGRTRQEVKKADGSVQSIHLHDPVDGARYILAPARKSATKMTMDRDLNKRIEALREKARGMAKDGKTITLEGSTPGQEIIVTRREGALGEGKREAHEEVRVNVVRADRNKDGAMPNILPQLSKLDAGSAGSALGALFQDHKWARHSTTRDLGSRFIEGVRAEGKATSYTIPAGEIGNQQPITVTRETWFSPELQVTVYSKQLDPRSGEQVYRLANLSRLEPAANLFTVPADYTLRETPLPRLNLHEERITK